jgi:hypothetical protein
MFLIIVLENTQHTFTAKHFYWERKIIKHVNESILISTRISGQSILSGQPTKLSELLK